ncbi:MAG: PIN domain nuclease [Spirochaetales bacterium]|nr:PIN domain nuclease [Spirochaetales bacterium]
MPTERATLSLTISSRDNVVCTNDLILTELVPTIHLREQDDLIEALLTLRRYEIVIDWQRITNFQIANLRHGVNGVGIPDLIILENVMTHDLTLFSKDKHFRLMKEFFDFRMFAHT